MKKASKQLPIMLTACLLAVAGCSKTDTSESAATPVGATPASVASPESKATPKAGEKVKIEYFQQKTEIASKVDKLISEFQEKNPNIIVEQNSVPNSMNVWTMRLSTNDMPPVFNHYPHNAVFQKAARDGSIVDLTNDPLLKDVQPAILEMSKIDGKNYLVPIALATLGVYYNEDMFKELNLSIPQTYSEFIETAEKIKAAGKVPFLFADKEVPAINFSTATMMGVQVPNAEKFFDDVMNGKVHITDNPDMKVFAKKIYDLRQFGQKNSLGVSREDRIREFANGKAAMFFEGIWSIQPTKEANPNLKFAMFPLPAEKAEDTKVQVTVDTGIGLPKDGKNQQEARKFIEFMASKEAVEEYISTSQYPAAIKGVKNNAVENKSLNDLINDGKIYAPLSRKWPPGALDEFGAATQELISTGNIDNYLKKLDSIFYNKQTQ
ncbi:extracellular solute-binding protein [Paenibacillus albiflavus]|uniref:Extracellular solute-binding protein n=1 Tax=Paenibacillus albiflavus TaxID=2545760 RepID=A0A4R4EBG8_9BACL|nr:extracellular solute-binding protein [Paenibacillus albiflavus]TCZ77226.1 extracellular solute-binding protein [Paenibacillus albiflavus]